MSPPDPPPRPHHLVATSRDNAGPSPTARPPCGETTSRPGGQARWTGISSAEYRLLKPQSFRRRMRSPRLFSWPRPSTHCRLCIAGCVSPSERLCPLIVGLSGAPVFARPVEAKAIGNVLVQVPAHGFVMGARGPVRGSWHPRSQRSVPNRRAETVIRRSPRTPSHNSCITRGSCCALP